MRKLYGLLVGLALLAPVPSMAQIGPGFCGTVANPCYIAGGGSGGTSSNFNSAFPSAGTAIGFSNGTNMVPGLVDGSGYLEVNVKAGGAGGGAVYGPTANGSAAANPPVIIGGTANGGATGNVANAMIVAGNTAGTTNPAIIVADPNVLAAVNAAVPGYYATAYNTCSQVTGTTAPICVDLNGNLYANISRYMGTAGSANAAVMTIQGVASMTKLLVTPDSVALPANQSVNTAQVNGVTTLTGAGATGTGAQRVTISQDATTVGGSGAVVAASTAPVTATNTAVVVDLRPDSPGIVALGQTTKSASVPVTIASDQGATPVSIASAQVASGAVASGAFASGSIASGALASGSIAAGAQVDLLTMRGTVAPGTAAANSILAGAVYTSTAPTLTTTQQAALQVSSRGGLLLGNGYPAGSTPITISATGTTGATTATLATGASVTTYICGFSIRANATAAATGNATVTGTITGTLNYTQWTAPTASGLGVTEQIFNPCIPASAVNTGIAVVSAAPSTGGVVSVSAWGFTL